jgi:hypothetical protein
MPKTPSDDIDGDLATKTSTMKLNSNVKFNDIGHPYLAQTTIQLIADAVSGGGGTNSNELKKSVYQACESAKVLKWGKNEGALVQDLYLRPIKRAVHNVDAKVTKLVDVIRLYYKIPHPAEAAMYKIGVSGPMGKYIFVKVPSLTEEEKKHSCLFMRWLMTLSVMMLAMYIWQKNSRH